MNLDTQALVPQCNEIFQHSFEDLWTTMSTSVIRVWIRDQNINWNISSMTKHLLARHSFSPYFKNSYTLAYLQNVKWWPRYPFAACMKNVCDIYMLWWQYEIFSYFFNISYWWIWGTRWCSWLRHYATRRKVAGSISDGVIEIFHWHNPSSRTMALGSTQPLTEMSTRSISWW